MTEEARKLIGVLRDGPGGAAERAKAEREALAAWVEAVEATLEALVARMSAGTAEDPA